MAGDAGATLNRMLYFSGRQREEFRIHNVLSCFPGDTILEASDVLSGFRREYAGELVTVETDGNSLTGTPNHPALTTRGWVPLGSLVEGDYLIRGAAPQRMTGSDPDIDYGPAPATEIHRALALAGVSQRIVGRNVDFHGDGRESDVEIVCHHGLLMNRPETTTAQQMDEVPLKAPDECLLRLLRPGAGQQPLGNLLFGGLPSSRCLVCGSKKGNPSLPIQPPPPMSHRLRTIPQGDPSFQKCLLESALSYTHSNSQGLERLPRKIGTSKVIKIKRRCWSGHVHNLSTASNQFVAQGFIVHNCRPPNNWLAGAPWEHEAIAHCSVHLERTLSQGNHQVVVPLGAVAARRLIGTDSGKMQDLHGTVSRDPLDRFWVVPSYHPSHLQRGGANLTKVVLWDLEQAYEIARKGFTRDPFTIVEDAPVEWFEHWIKNYFQVLGADPWSIWLIIDIETPEKGDDEGELKIRDPTSVILRVNFSCSLDEGMTVPYEGPYISGIRRLCASKGVKVFWFEKYDVPRLEKNACPVPPPIIDAMDMCHVLQSDVPRGLGFWAPMFSNAGPWKHLSYSRPAYYGGMDGLQTSRVAHGAAERLVAAGQWDLFIRHYMQMGEVAYRPSEKVGVLVDTKKLPIFEAKLAKYAKDFLTKIQELVPETVRVFKKPPWLKKPVADEILWEGKIRPVITHQVEREVKACRTCKAVGITIKHRCKDEKGKIDKDATPAIIKETRSLPQYTVRLDFNPGSWQQVLAFILHHGHKPGRNKQTGGPSTDKNTLNKLSKHAMLKEKKKPDESSRLFYRTVLSYREVTKVKNTYVDGTLKRLERDRAEGITDGRLRPTVTNKPSTGRTAYVNPNLQNVVSDRESNLAAGFKGCIISAPGCKLVSIDYSAIESMATGWCANSPDYIRLAKLGVHAFLASHVLHLLFKDPDVKEPASLDWDRDRLLEHFAWIKKNRPLPYDRSKRTVHGVSYGLTEFGMAENFPETFPSIGEARKVRNLFLQIAPDIPVWQDHVIQLAAKQHYLGGPGPHPFGYKHWFWDVYNYRRITDSEAIRRERLKLPYVKIDGRFYKVQLGHDAKRAIAFYPQSIAAGIIKEAGLQLFTPGMPHYIGEAFYGKTPLRALIHDDFFMEVPDAKVDQVIEHGVQVMSAPIPELYCPPEWEMGKALSIGVEVKVGRSWDKMEKVKVDGIAADTGMVEDYDDEDEVEVWNVA